MKALFQKGVLVLLCLVFTGALIGQGSADYTGGLKVKLNDDGSKYFRLITWHQMWSTTTLSNSGAADFESSTDFLLRRSRFLMFAQINKRFLILTHFGLNSLSPANMGTASPTPGAGSNGRFFMHDAWVEYTVFPKKLSIGGGLHYWNGISRLTNQSTLNILTLDAPIHNWANIGTSDQFARHLGFYAKGKLGKFDYRISLNEALTNPTRGGNLESIEMRDDEGNLTGYVTDQGIYRNPTNPGGGKILAGYFKYEFLDAEGGTLPYLVGSYLGSKKVFNIGAGFFYHGNGAVFSENGTDLTEHSPLSFGADVFYDSPLGDNGSAITAYASYVSHDWGPNWTGAVGGAGTGSILYGQVGYLLGGSSKDKARFQPYAHYTNRGLNAFDNYEDGSASTFGIGGNLILDGHNAKISAEYQASNGAAAVGDGINTSLLRLQMMLYF